MHLAQCCRLVVVVSSLIRESSCACCARSWSGRCRLPEGQEGMPEVQEKQVSIMLHPQSRACAMPPPPPGCPHHRRCRRYRAAAAPAPCCATCYERRPTLLTLQTPFCWLAGASSASHTPALRPRTVMCHSHLPGCSRTAPACSARAPRAPQSSACSATPSTLTRAASAWWVLPPPEKLRE